MAENRKPAKPSIPAWQQAGQHPSSDSSDVVQDATTPPAPSSDSEPATIHASGGSPGNDEHELSDARSSTLTMQEVQRFLEDPGVRDAPEEKKRSFLESKGVSKEMVDKILLAQTTQSDANNHQQQRFEPSEFKAQAVAPVREIPPIVTYPEFLVKPQKPPPLVTISRLLNTAYIAGSLAAVFYGVSTYLVEPMTASLTEARHDLASHSEGRVRGLNEKLSTIVSKIPEPSQSSDTNAETAVSEAESVTSDPTELFYHDVGVQTSPIPSRRSSTDSSLSPEPTKSSAQKHEEHLRTIKSHLSGMIDGEVSNLDTNGILESSVGDLREYLNGLIYSPPTPIEYGMWNTNASSEKQKNDAISALRDEIRGVKGVLLSARRFPARNATARAN